MHRYTTDLREKLTRLANPGKAVSMKAYMKNQFDFLGITTPERRQSIKEYVKLNRIEDETELSAIAKELWTLPEREFQYCAVEVLYKNKKLWTLKTIEIIEFCVTTKSWWDTVDPLSYDCAGSYFKMFPRFTRTITGRWNVSDNLWLQRSSLLFQKTYKKATDTNLLSNYILALASSKEFFIQKAIGWVLREYAKTDPEWVKNFVDVHELAPFSKREALKHL